MTLTNLWLEILYQTGSMNNFFSPIALIGRLRCIKGVLGFNEPTNQNSIKSSQSC